jgi:hypothetical protein
VVGAQLRELRQHDHKLAPAPTLRWMFALSSAVVAFGIAYAAIA